MSNFTEPTTTYIPVNFSCLFCEDVRREIGGSESFIGVFRPGVNLPDFPFVMPKLALVVHGSFPIDTPRNSLRVWVDASWQKLPVFDTTAVTKKLSETDVAEAEALEARIVSTFNLLEIPEPGQLRVWGAIDGGDKFRIGGLKFQRMPEQQDELQENTGAG